VVRDLVVPTGEEFVYRCQTAAIAYGVQRLHLTADQGKGDVEVVESLDDLLDAARSANSMSAASTRSALPSTPQRT